MRDFVIRTNKHTAVFRLGTEFTEGDNRLCWTAIGLEKMIDLGLWDKDIDARDNLKANPLRVEEAMRLPTARPLVLGLHRRG